MPAWLIPALKAVLPHIGTIISAAAPVFTRKNADAVANQTLLLQQQITELQSAASQNAAHIKELAAQLQRDRKSTRLNSSHGYISYAVFCLKKKKKTQKKAQ